MFLSDSRWDQLTSRLFPGLDLDQASVSRIKHTVSHKTTPQSMMCLSSRLESAQRACAEASNGNHAESGRPQHWRSVRSMSPCARSSRSCRRELEGSESGNPSHIMTTTVEFKELDSSSAYTFELADSELLLPMKVVVLASLTP